MNNLRVFMICLFLPPPPQPTHPPTHHPNPSPSLPRPTYSPALPPYQALASLIPHHPPTPLGWFETVC